MENIIKHKNRDTELKKMSRKMKIFGVINIIYGIVVSVAFSLLMLFGFITASLYTAFFTFGNVQLEKEHIETFVSGIVGIELSFVLVGFVIFIFSFAVKNYLSLVKIVLIASLLFSAYQFIDYLRIIIFYDKMSETGSFYYWFYGIVSTGGILLIVYLILFMLFFMAHIFPQLRILYSVFKNQT